MLTLLEAADLPVYAHRGDLVPATISEISAALARDATARRIIEKGHVLVHGQRVGIRLNINVLKSTGVCVHSVHQGKAGDGWKHNRGWWGGSVLTYLPVVTLNDVYFNVDQKARERIALGGAKDPMASVDGLLDLVSPSDFSGVEVSFNPRRTHLFVDDEGCAVRRAERVTILGHRAYLRGAIEYYSEETAPQRAGDAPTVARYREAAGPVVATARQIPIKRFGDLLDACPAQNGDEGLSLAS